LSGSIDNVKVEPATRTDVPSWMEIVRQVEPLFGPMPDFREVLARNVARGTALLVRDDDGAVIGGVLLSVKKDRCVIGWLAVRAAGRRAGVGRVLLEAALGAMAGSVDVTVDTFGGDNTAGEPSAISTGEQGFFLQKCFPQAQPVAVASGGYSSEFPADCRPIRNLSSEAR
jgi:hypothetical protein